MLYNDGGNNTGVGNAGFGSVVDFVNNAGQNASTEPAKRFYKYARSWRWSGSVQVLPALVPAKSGTPATDGGLISGHAAEATRDGSALMAAVGASSPEAFGAYAHSQTAGDDRFADHGVNRAAYLRRLTYGFAPIGDTGRPSVVPKEAEVLLETRLPYLDAAQRRVVLKTTALPSGYPAMDDAEGWGRLNLFAAADGYGAFNGDVAVTMDAALGGFNASDRWLNDIAGAGKLSKRGSGRLALAGSNSFSGGTQVLAGVLQADSATALGKGDVYLSGGTLVSQAATALKLAGAFTQLADATLELDIGSGDAGRLSVGGVLTVAGGNLKVTFRPGCAPAIGDTLSVIGANTLRGRFATITVQGFQVTPTYTATGLLLHIDG